MSPPPMYMNVFSNIFHTSSFLRGEKLAAVLKCNFFSFDYRNSARLLVGYIASDKRAKSKKQGILVGKFGPSCRDERKVKTVGYLLCDEGSWKTGLCDVGVSNLIRCCASLLSE